MMNIEQDGTKRLSFRDILNPISDGESSGSYFNVFFDEATCYGNNSMCSDAISNSSTNNGVVQGSTADINMPRYVSGREGHPRFAEKFSSRNALDSHSHRDLQYPVIMTNSHYQISSSDIDCRQGSQLKTYPHHGKAIMNSSLRPSQQPLPPGLPTRCSYLPTYYYSRQTFTINHQSSIDDRVCHRVEHLNHIDSPPANPNHLESLDHIDNSDDYGNPTSNFKSDDNMRSPIWHGENPSTCPRTCANCGTYKTPSWRRCSAQHIILCNACGLYYNEHKRHRPFRTNADGRTRAVRSTKYKLIDGEECPECRARMAGDTHSARALKQICGTCNYLRFQRLCEGTSRN